MARSPLRSDRRNRPKANTATNEPMRATDVSSTALSTAWWAMGDIGATVAAAHRRHPRITAVHCLAAEVDISES